MRCVMALLVSPWAFTIAACFPPALPQPQPEDSGGDAASLDVTETPQPEDTTDASWVEQTDDKDTASSDSWELDVVPADAQPLECQVDLDCEPVDRCIGSGQCNDGRCEVVTALGCETPSNPCLAAVCEPATGTCGFQPKRDSIACDDGNACTTEDACKAGQCIGAPVVCEAEDCRLGRFCDLADGVCKGDNAPTGTTCTTNETDAGSCFDGRCERLPFVSVGSTHACAIVRVGEVRCWGSNSLGQLGYGNTDSVGGAGQLAVLDAGPVDVAPVDAIFTGTPNTCFLVSGAFRCVGAATNGTLGLENLPTFNPGSTQSTVPRLLAPLPPIGTSARWISLGGFHGCAVTDVGGVRCWCPQAPQHCGRGDQLKVGFDVTIAEAGDLSLSPPEEVFSTVSVVSGAGFPASSLFHCAMSAHGRIRCWGSASMAGVETDDFVGDDEPPHVRPFVNPAWIAKQLVGSPKGRACALTTTGLVHCWGDGSYGALGNGQATHRQTAVMVGIIGVRQIAMGVDHTCALSNDDTVRCWGRNHVGQLGRGSTTNYGDDPSRPPTLGAPVNLGGPVYAIAAGGHVSCAVMNNGDIRCWGAGGYLGNGSDENVGDDSGEMPPPRIIWR